MMIKFPSKDQGLKICPKCGKVISFNSYFGGYVCDNCGFINNMTLSQDQFEEITDVMLHTIDDVITIADKYGINRDTLIQYFASTFISMISVSTFQGYKKGEKDDEDKNRD